jgi:hypothetical protein
MNGSARPECPEFLNWSATPAPGVTRRRTGRVREADKGLLPGCDQHLTLGLDGVNLEPTHGQGAAPLKHDPFGLKMLSSRRCDEVDLVLHGEDSRVIGKAGEGGVAAGPSVERCFGNPIPLSDFGGG